MADRIGQQLGNYRLLKHLASGGNAEVYLGEHIYLETQAAIKVLSGQLSPQQEQEFRDEARTIAKLIHPNIVRVLEFGVEQDGTPFLVMDYGSNGTLRNRHPVGTQLSLPMVISYVNQVASALQTAHSKKIIHRDIKPENMLLGPNNEVWVSDFGIYVIAHSTQSQTRQGLAGTWKYTAPEQFKGKAQPASDQYALGIVAYEWLGGRPPFQGSSFEELYDQHLTIPPPQLHTITPTIPLEVEDVVLKALCKDPKQRFASVQEFASALEQANQIDQTTSPTNPLRGSSVLPTLQQSLIVPTIPYAASPLLPTLPAMETTPVGTVLYSYENKQFGRFYYLAWSPAGRQIAFCAVSPAKGYREYLAGIWDITAEQDRRKSILSFFSSKPLPTRGRVFTYPDFASSCPIVLAWCPDEMQIAFAGNFADDTGRYTNVVQLWSILKGNKLLSYSGHSNEIKAVVCSPDGTHIASMEGQGMLHVWNTRTRHATYTHQFHSAYSSVLSLRSEAKEPIWLPRGLHWLPQGLRLVFATKWLVEVQEATTGKKLCSFEVKDFPLYHDLYALSWSPNGQYIAIAICERMAYSERTSVYIWNVTTDKQIFTYNNHSGYPRDLAWSPDGNRIASACTDGTIQVWDAFTGTNVFTYRSPVWCIAWSPDGRHIASGGDDSTIQVWNAL